jgi:hypothetical protein
MFSLLTNISSFSLLRIMKHIVAIFVNEQEKEINWKTLRFHFNYFEPT